MKKYTTHNEHNPNEVGIDVRQLLQRCRRYWYIFVLSTLATSALAWAYLRYTVPVYEVKSAILLKDEKNKQGVSATDLISKELGLGDKKMLADEAKLMNSYLIVEKVVKKLKLDRAIYKRGTVRDEELYGATSPLIIDSLNLRDTVQGFKAALDIIDDSHFELITADGAKQTLTFGTPFSNKYGDFVINKALNPTLSKEKALRIVCRGVEPTVKGVIASIDMDLPVKESNIIKPTVKTPIPERGKDITHAMVNAYNELRLFDKKEVSQNTLNFIESRLLSLTSELSGVEQTMETYKRREGITSESQTDIGYFFSRLNQYDGELVRMEVQNDIFENIEAILKRPSVNIDLLPTNLEIKSTSLQGQINDFNKLVLERNKLMKVAGENNPNLKSVTDDLYSLKKAIIDNIARLKQENKTLLAETQSKNNQFTSRLGKTPRNERELTDIKRQQNIKQGLYLFLLQKQEETAIALVGATTEARIIDRPSAGALPITTKKPVIHAIALLAGLFLGFLLVIMRGLFVNTVQSENDIKQGTTMPILAKIPLNKGKNSLVVGDGKNAVIAEMFGFLRSNLEFLLPYGNSKNTGNVIMITSSKRGEGKSFIALNLGMTLALSHKKTVILNLDLRRKNPIIEAFSNKNAGIAQYLSSEIYPPEIIQPSGKHRDLSFIHIGSVQSNPASLLTHPKLGELITYLKNNFDYILIATPPVGLVSDALTIKAYADVTLFITRLGTTKLKDLDTIQSFETNLRLPNPVIVYNGIKGADRKEDVYYNNNGIVFAPISDSNVLSGWFKKVFS
jgi:tyrosine-protein kinase Etk/Wzc